MTQAILVEVGPRDGFQSVGPLIPTSRKIEFIRALYDAGLRRMEAAAFVSDAAVPQMADARDVLQAASELDGLDVQVLVPNERHARRALDAGSRHLSFVLSASEAHNQANVRRSPDESVAALGDIVEMAPPGTRMRVNVATAFDCPFSGAVDPLVVIELVGALVERAPECEIALCDTTGRANPQRVGALFAACLERYQPARGWAFHGHDTYGLGAANALAAWNAGVRIFDASVAGLGGCPFAPGATGNVATEDLVWMFAGMGALEGVDMDRLLLVAARTCELDGAQVGGRVRVAEAAKRRIGGMS